MLVVLWRVCTDKCHYPIRLINLLAIREFVTNPMYGFDNIFAAFFRKFLANVANVAVNGAVTHVDIAVIRAAHNGIAAEYPRRLACKQLQHGKFGSSQGNVLPLPTGGVLLWLNCELTQAQFTGGNRRILV